MNHSDRRYSWRIRFFLEAHTNYRFLGGHKHGNMARQMARNETRTVRHSDGVPAEIVFGVCCVRDRACGLKKAHVGPSICSYTGWYIFRVDERHLASLGSVFCCMGFVWSFGAL